MLKGEVERLNEEPGKGVARSQAQLMLRVVERLERLSESLLDFARVRPPAREPVVVRGVVERAWTLVSLDREVQRVERIGAQRFGVGGVVAELANLAAYLALRRGRRVLAIDMDPQGQLGKVFGIDVQRSQRSSIDLLLDTVLADDPIGSAGAALDTGGDGSLPVVPTRIPQLELVKTWRVSDATSKG